VVHHIFRIYLMYTCTMFTSISYDVILPVLAYIFQCMFLYVQHGKLYNGHSAWFRVPFKWMFFASIVSRILFYPNILYKHYSFVSKGEEPQWTLVGRAVFPFLIFDVFYLVYHFCIPPPPKDKEKKV